MTVTEIVVSTAVVLAVLTGIRLLSSPKTAVAGNRLGALAMLGAIVAVLLRNQVVDAPLLLAGLVAGGLIGIALAARTTMLGIPQLVALFNGLGGLASFGVAALVVLERAQAPTTLNIAASGLAMIVGGATFSGSMIAAAKLARKMNQRPMLLPGHGRLCVALLIVMTTLAVSGAFMEGRVSYAAMAGAAVAALVFGVVFSIRIGGADMPVTIALLNALSGMAAAICGFAVENELLIAIGAIVGSAGLILTKIMCRAMNRSLRDILTGGTACAPAAKSPTDSADEPPAPESAPEERAEQTPEQKIETAATLIRDAKSVMVVPGYGMALSQAQTEVKRLFDRLSAQDTDVKFAIHPVAGRMPGHMNVLLAEVDIPYDRLMELEDVNPLFADIDAVLVVGACDVVNPAAISAEGTPIYGMPILHVHEAKNTIVCNLDAKPGYSGVDNPLYENNNVVKLWGNAAETLAALIDKLS